MGKIEDIANSLRGLSLREAFDVHIRDDPEVQDLHKQAVRQSSSDTPFIDLENMLYVIPQTHWPIISNEWISLKSDWADLLYPELTDADAELMKAIAVRFDLVLDPIRTGTLHGYGHLADGTAVTMNRNIWSTQGYFIDFNRSEVGRCTEHDKEFVPIWYAVELRKVADAGEVDPPANTETIPKSRRPGVAAVRAAHQALFPNGVPAGLRAKERNNKIKEWIKDNGRSGVSTRTIERFYKWLKENSSKLK